MIPKTWHPALLLLLAASAIARAQGSGEVQLDDDRFSVAQSVILGEPITGDALLAGGNVEVNASVGGDAALAGGTVAVRGTVTDDLYAAAGQLAIDARIGGNIRAAGGSVAFAPESDVAGGVAVAAGTVRIDGTIGRYVTVAGGDVTIGGDIAGDVRVAASRLTVLPGTHIGGRLRYRAASAEIAADAVIDGGAALEPEEPQLAPAEQAVRTAGWFWLGGLLVVGALLAYGFGRLTTAASGLLSTRPWFAMGVGTLVLMVTPAIGFFLFVTVIGIPLALLLGLLYFSLLLGGFVVGAMHVGDRALARLRPTAAPTPGWRLLALAGVLIALGIVSALPLVGSLARFALLVLGIGGIVLVAAGRGAPQTVTTG